MDYTPLNAKQLQELCRSRKLPTARAKADMIETLTADDAATELTQLAQEDKLYDAVPALEEVQQGEDPEPVSEPSQSHTWLENGFFCKSFPRDGRMSNIDHQTFIETTELEARKAGYQVRGGANRIQHEDETVWAYQVGVL